MLNLPEFEVIKKEVNEYYYKFTVVAKDRQIITLYNYNFTYIFLNRRIVYDFYFRCLWRR